MSNAKTIFLLFIISAAATAFSTDNFNESALFEQGEPPLIINADPAPTDLHYPYAKRKHFSTVPGGEELIKRAAFKITHLPWTLVAPSVDKDDAFKLKDVVVDRIVDPKTNASYVKMYHGTTNDLIDIFKPGSSAIKFNVAERTALGMGFYLAANVNEAKDYACTRLAQRKKGNPNLQGLLLVVGVLENDIIQGKLVDPKLPKNYSDQNTGDPVDPSIYFVRNETRYNQFVFFTNAAPYMKIFEIIMLPQGFGKAPSIDYDGLPETSTVPQTNIQYKCRI